MAQTTPVLPHRANAKRRGGRDRPPQDDRAPLFLKGGRAWINGREVGGTDPRYAHLDRFYD